MTIGLISTNKNATTFIKERLGESHELIEETNAFFYIDNTIEVLLIVEPFELKKDKDKKERGGIYTSIFRVWKNYLNQEYPEIKLIVAGFEDIKMRNYIQLLNLTKDTDFSKITKKAASNSENWEKRLKINGICLLEKLSIFFRGHSHLGIIDVVSKIRRSLNSAYLHYNGNKDLRIVKKDFNYIWKEYLYPIENHAKILYNRWHHYQSFFEIFPFWGLIDENQLEKFIYDLKILIVEKYNINLKPQVKQQKEKDFINIDAYQQIDVLIKTFDKINKRYVTIEKIGRILMIDDDIDFYKQIKSNFPSYDIVHEQTQTKALSKLKKLQAAKKEKIDLILLDLDIEGQKDGLNLLPKIKKSFPDIPVIIVSTHTDLSIIKETLDKDAYYYLQKTQYDLQDWSRVFLFALSGKYFLRETIIAANNEQNKSIRTQKILVIEDQKYWFDAIKDLDNKYNYTWAFTIKQAEDLLKNEKFDLILLDLLYKNEEDINEEQGLAFIPKFEKISNQTPIIVFTQHSDIHMGNRAISSGAAYYLRKSDYDPLIWRQTIRMVINQRPEYR